MDTTQKGDIIDIETVKPPEIEGVFLVVIELMPMTKITGIDEMIPTYNYTYS